MKQVVLVLKMNPASGNYLTFSSEIKKFLNAEFKAFRDIKSTVIVTIKKLG